MLQACLSRNCAAEIYEQGVLSFMSARRLDDRIRELCATAVEAKSPDKVRRALSELRGAIHEYTRRLRQRALSSSERLKPSASVARFS